MNTSSLDAREQVAVSAAQIWAQQKHAGPASPVEFGIHVMQVYLAAIAAYRNDGDARAMAAATAALSIPDETLQYLVRFGELCRQGLKAESCHPVPAVDTSAPNQ